MKPRSGQLLFLRRAFPLVAAAFLLVTGAATAPASAQPTDAEAGSQAGEAADAAAPDEDDLSRAERKQLAKEQRIQEYLRKREERRARNDLERTEPASEAQAQGIESEQLAGRKAPAPPSPPASPVPDTATRPADKRAGKATQATSAPARSRLPRGLAEAQQNVRSTALGLDPTVQEYLTLIEAQEASAEQLAAFANFLAQNGLVGDALEYYEVALRLENDNPLLWVNFGTLQMQRADYSSAASAFTRALRLDPNLAVAHYNLGAALDEMNQYESAVAEYKAALTLDPLLGDASYNPQAANNDLLVAVKLMLYQEQAGSLSLPLIDLATGQVTGAGGRE